MQAWANIYVIIVDALIGIPVFLAFLAPFVLLLTILCSPLLVAVSYFSERRAYRSQQQSPSINILVADDDSISVAPLMNLLSQKKSVKVQYVQSGSEVMRELNHTPYDLVFMDVMMPELSGIDTLYEFDKKHVVPNSIPVVFYTGFRDSQYPQLKTLKQKELNNFSVWGIWEKGTSYPLLNNLVDNALAKLDVVAA